MNLKNYIAEIQDFPIEGVLFRDITPLMNDGEAFFEATRRIQEFAETCGAEIIVGPESRGFIFGCPVAVNMKIGFVPVRKPGKLPRKTISYKYDLEYGSNELHMHADSIKKGQKVLIVDDLLATGGTVEATIKLVEEMGGEVVGCAFLIELLGLEGRKALGNYNVFTVMSYE
ncbi:adenine phosphoribosyltransferase [Anaerorhabdus furcosa]|uniref:Adenine phosphoribosyltransferase n=1 Tax=Anaerorhabdus furcosa TaxID=118967 RepID=A0A1T4P219_9FIRM|nr:adenine phosphoribosyltransferase [Anaerorhabdus furcosa]SJZ84988.1 adenine phosphoribosyltransferase [Anaerorhabdus furcosa]